MPDYTADQVLNIIDTSVFHLAPVGEALPDVAAAPAGNWAPVGYLDGFPTMPRSSETNDVILWPSTTAIKVLESTETHQIQFKAAQMSSLSMDMFLGTGAWATITGGGEWSGTGVAKEYAALLTYDFSATERLRFAFGKVVVETVGNFETPADAPATMEFTLKKLAADVAADTFVPQVTDAFATTTGITIV